MNMCSKLTEMGVSLGEDRGLCHPIMDCVLQTLPLARGWLALCRTGLKVRHWPVQTYADFGPSQWTCWYSIRTCWGHFLTSTCRRLTSWAIGLKTSFISLSSSGWWHFKRQFNLAANRSRMKLNCLPIVFCFTCSSQCVAMSFE